MTGCPADKRERHHKMPKHREKAMCGHSEKADVHKPRGLRRNPTC